METKNIILKLRTERGMSQDELADKIMVTRQAVSRWENGDTVPNTDTLKLLSKEFDVSINTLLGEPRKLICQCCGMPIDDDSVLGTVSPFSQRDTACLVTIILSASSSCDIPLSVRSFKIIFLVSIVVTSIAISYR